MKRLATRKSPRPNEPVRAKRNQNRVHFDCSGCGAHTDAFKETERGEKQLCRVCFGKGKDRRPRELNDLDGKAWAAYSKSVEKFPDIRSDKQRVHGASYPLSFAKQHIEMYSKKGDLVIDPFVGVGTTADACSRLGRRCVGTDINREFIKLAKDDLKGSKSIKLVCDDALRLGKYVDDGSADLLLTSPPYSNLLKTVKGSFAFKWKEHSTIGTKRNPPKYSDASNDLGNLEYSDYVTQITEVMKVSAKALKKGAYSIWVVKDYRDLKRKVPYVNLHGDTIKCAEAAGFTLWDIRIFDQTQFRPLVCLGFPSRNYYLNIGHSYILVFRNG